MDVHNLQLFITNFLSFTIHISMKVALSNHFK
jgi:hypothetical protein